MKKDINVIVVMSTEKAAYKERVAKVFAKVIYELKGAEEIEATIENNKLKKG